MASASQPNEPTCVCQLRSSASTISVNELPLRAITDDLDRTHVLNAARLMLVLHHPRVAALSWHVDDDPSKGEYHISVAFPAGTWFSLNQLSLVQQVNDYYINDVWVQPSELNVRLCASMRKSSTQRHITVSDLFVVTHKLQTADTSRRSVAVKRRRLDSNSSDSETD